MGNLNLGCSPCWQKEPRGLLPQIRASFNSEDWKKTFMGCVVLPQLSILDGKIHKNIYFNAHVCIFWTFIPKIKVGSSESYWKGMCLYRLCFFLLQWFEKAALPFSPQKLSYGVLHHTRRRCIRNYHRISSSE